METTAVLGSRWPLFRSLSWFAPCLLAGCVSYVHQVPEYRDRQGSSGGGPPVQIVLAPLTLPTGEQLEFIDANSGNEASVAVKVGTESRHISLPSLPRGVRSNPRFAGVVRPGLVVVERSHYGDEAGQDLVICDTRQAVATDSISTPNHDNPTLGAREGDLWISLPALEQRPDPTAGMTASRSYYELEARPVDQVLHQVTAEGKLISSGVRVACRTDQVLADRANGLMYSTSWDGGSLEQRTAAGALQKSWPKPKDLMHIRGLWPGFGRYEVRAYGWKHGADDLFGASSVLYGFDVEEQAWQWLETVRNGAPWTRI